MKRWRILKLGWEFPPMVNGGLGVACLGLSRALARHVDLSVLVPRVEGAAPAGNFGLRGASAFGPTPPGPAAAAGGYREFAALREIDVPLDPYKDATASARGPASAASASGEGFSPAAAGDLSVLARGGLYDGELGAKVVEFSRVAVQLALREDFDLIHAHDWMTFLAGVEVKRATGRPLVVHVHATQYDRAGHAGGGWIHDLEKLGMEAADRVIPVSRYTAGILTSHYGIDPLKLRPVHNGAEPVEAFVTKKKFPEKLVLFLGRLTAQKGPEFFLEIASHVLSLTPDVRFVMAGTGEKLRPLIESGAFRGLGGHFHFTGFLDPAKVHELLSMTDVYCMPSVSEPFGLSALEAAQFGIPAVISKQSGVAEVLRGALFADFWDVKAMASHIHRLLTDEELRGEVVARARQDIAGATWDAAAGKVLAVYGELLD